MLLLGGPLHGQDRDLTEIGQTEMVVMAASANGLPAPFKYVLKTIEAETRPGVVFSHSFWVDPSMPLEVASQALGSILMQNLANELVRQYMEGGKQVDSESPLIVAKR